MERCQTYSFLEEDSLKVPCQRCPLSPYISIMCIELLSHEIRTNINIKGLTIAGKEAKAALFADDATFSTDGSRQYFEVLVNVLENFKNISNLDFNNRKCNILRGFLIHTHSDMNRKIIVQCNSQRKESANAGGRPGCFPSSVILG